jgi:inner membrane protein
MKTLRSKGTKAIIVAGLVLIMSIALLPINNLVNERNQLQQKTKAEVSQQWSKSQRIYGPYLKVYGKRKVTDIEYVNGKLKERIRHESDCVFLSPSDLIINGNVNPQKRKRGIYEVILYDSDFNVEGSFDRSKVDNGLFSEIYWDKTEFYFGISDTRGLNENVVINIGGEKLTLENSAKPELLKVNLNNISEEAGKLDFKFDLKFRGSEHVEFTPNSANTKIKVSSPWQSPSFYGDFLPISHEISEKGFIAKWNVLEMNRNIPAISNLIDVSTEQSYVFGVKLIEVNDNYQKNQRAVKYGILIISLTFLGFFFSEILLEEYVHIIQYGLVGAALIVFYCLLLSFSEIITFNPAYLLSSLMTVGLIFTFCLGIFKTNKPPLVISLITSISYGFIFMIIQLEDTALLVGSLGLFTILGIIMWVSRKVNWEMEAGR